MDGFASCESKAAVFEDLWRANSALTSLTIVAEINREICSPEAK